MFTKQRGSVLITILVFTWLIALLLAGALYVANSLDLFGPDDPVARLDLPAGNPGLAALPPTWTPDAPTSTSETTNPGDSTVTPEPYSESGPRFEPSNTPVNPFPPTPTFVITPIAVSEGPVEFGKSVAGRELVFYRFGTGAVHRMIVAGIHGGYEWNTTHLAEELIAHLQENPELVPRNVTLFIIPSLNPDGYERGFGFEGRVNENGVDLNRNFPVNWSSDWDRTKCWNFAPTSSGSKPGSEVEAQALMKFIKSRTRVTALISYHSAALGIFPGGDPPDEESARLAEALAGVSTYPYPPIDIGCEYTGTLADWAASEGIAAVDLELHTHYFTDFEENLEILKEFLNWRR